MTISFYCGGLKEKVKFIGTIEELYNKNLAQLRQDLNNAIYEDNNCMNVVDNRTTLDEWYEKTI